MATEWFPGLIGVDRPDDGPTFGQVVVGVIVVIVIWAIIF